MKAGWIEGGPGVPEKADGDGGGWGGFMQGPVISGVTEWQVELWNWLIELELIN